MNKKETAEMIAVMQAYVDGEEIEYNNMEIPRKWCRIHSLIKNNGWEFSEYNYRIKPKPREYWANIYPSDPPMLHSTKVKAISAMGKGCIETIKVREVLENE